MARSHSRTMFGELVPAVVAVAFGAGAMPALIYLAGSTLLGQYEGGSLRRIYQTVLGGLVHGSVSSWIVVLGPLVLWQLVRALIRAWRRRTPASPA